MNQQRLMRLPHPSHGPTCCVNALLTSYQLTSRLFRFPLTIVFGPRMLIRRPRCAICAIVCECRGGLCRRDAARAAFRRTLGRSSRRTDGSAPYPGRERPPEEDAGSANLPLLPHPPTMEPLPLDNLIHYMSGDARARRSAPSLQALGAAVNDASSVPFVGAHLSAIFCAGLRGRRGLRDTEGVTRGGGACTRACAQSPARRPAPTRKALPSIFVLSNARPWTRKARHCTARTFGECSGQDAAARPKQTRAQSVSPWRAAYVKLGRGRPRLLFQSGLGNS